MSGLLTFSALRARDMAFMRRCVFSVRVANSGMPCRGIVRSPCPGSIALVPKTELDQPANSNSKSYVLTASMAVHTWDTCQAAHALGTL